MEKKNRHISAIIVIFMLMLTTMMMYSISNVHAEDKKMIGVYFSCDYQEVQGQNGHTYAPTVERIRAAGINWGTFDITVTDSSGKVYKVPRKDSGTQEIYLGQFPLGETLNVKVNPDSIPQGYHLSAEYNPINKKWEFMSKNYKVGGADGTDLGYNDTYTIRIALGKTDAVFDLNGGNVNGKTERITERINRDDTVNYPEPEKKGLTFMKYWFTIDDNNVVHWIQQGSSLSDYSHDWVRWNKESFDPKYDGKFVMRAGYWGQVSFDTDGGSKEKTQWIIEGNKPLKPKEDPKKDGYVFVNWVDKDGNVYDFNKPITEHTVIYAKWDKIKTENPIKKPTIAPVTEGDSIIKILDPTIDDSSVNGITVKLADGTEIRINKDEDGWRIAGGDRIKVIDNYLNIPVDPAKIKANDIITAIAHRMDKSSEPAEVKVTPKKHDTVVPSPSPGANPSNPHEATVVDKAENSKPSIPYTGDNDNIYMLMIVLLASVGLAVSLYKQK